jgi:stearoyl-CoA desaturase (delta-9 desaturase)
VRAVITHRYYVLAQYTRSVRNACRQEIYRLARRSALRGEVEIDAASAGKLLRWLRLHSWDRRGRQPLTLDPVLRKHQLLQTVYSMRQELGVLWSRSAASGSATAEQSLKLLCDWRARAEASGIAGLRDFARRLPQLI